MVTLKTIAEQAGCSEATVSRVLNGKAEHNRISKNTQQEILNLAKKLNFQPNLLARSLRTRRTRTIGLAIPDISNPFFASIAKNIEHESRHRGYSVILCDTEEDTDLEIESLHLLQHRNVEGLIVSPVGREVEHLLALRRSEMPMVLIDRYFPDIDIPFVASDNFMGARNAIAHLIKNGHRIIACIQGLTNTTPNNERVRGYRDAHLQAGINVDPSLIVGDSFGEENGYLETKLLLKRNPRPTALFALSNLISLGALRAISEERLSVPGDISIVSFDDQPYSRFLSTPMTMVAQQTREMGRIAIKMLFNTIKLKSNFKSEGILLPTTLIKRQSVGTI
jgi:LacI family transcriptional regulator